MNFLVDWVTIGGCNLCSSFGPAPQVFDVETSEMLFEIRTNRLSTVQYCQACPTSNLLAIAFSNYAVEVLSSYYLVSDVFWTQDTIQFSCVQNKSLLSVCSFGTWRVRKRWRTAVDTWAGCIGSSFLLMAHSCSPPPTIRPSGWEPSLCMVQIESACTRLPRCRYSDSCEECYKNVLLC